MRKNILLTGTAIFFMLFTQNIFAQPFTPVHTGLIASFGTWTYSNAAQITGDASQGDIVRLYNAAAGSITSPSMDFTTCGSTPYLTFKLRNGGATGTALSRANITIEVSTNGGATWSNEGTVGVTAASTWFIISSIDLSAYSAFNNVLVRLRASGSPNANVRAPYVDDIHIYCGTPPANDECATAISIVPGALGVCTPTAGTLNYATQSVPVSACGGSGNDVWYTFNATAATMAIQVSGGADMDAVVELLSGACGGLTSLQCEDNTFSGGTETLIFGGLTIGNAYYVRIYNYFDAPPFDDSFTICVFESSAAASNCSNPTPIACGATLAGQSNVGAGNDANSWGCHLDGLGFPITTNGEDYFYSVTTASAGFIRITIDNASGTGTSYLEVIANAGACVAGTCTASSQLDLSTGTFGTGLNSMEFSVPAAGTYYIIIDAQGAGSTLNWDITVDCFASGILLDNVNNCGAGFGTGDANQGIYTTWNGANAPATYDASLGGTYTVCENIYLMNTGGEWLMYYDILLGSCWTNISNITPNGLNNGFYDLTGDWAGTYNGGTHEINWSFTYSGGNPWGDGINFNPSFFNYTCMPFSFCYQADIDPTCSDANGLQNIISATDDGVGVGGSSAPSNVLVTYPWSENVSTLPVTLINFRAACASDQTSLYWATASEINNDYFTVERSFDGVNFEEIYRIPGAANSNSIQGYRVFDKIFPQVVYYRLSQTDFNGETMILKTVPANCNDAFDFDAIVYNDCANGFVAVQFTSIIGYGYNINVTDIQGRSVYNSNLKAEASNSEFVIPVAELNKGIYTLTITSKDASHTEKFFIE
ncbi:MAG: T9SS type A sorting domain-containing protein [Bacteroidales bacterium]|nr:T9SS type A sorting domain-containing protein [Bacteroidales bacterium]